MKVIRYPIGATADIYEFIDTGELFICSDGQYTWLTGLTPRLPTDEANKARMRELDGIITDMVQPDGPGIPAEHITQDVIDRLDGAYEDFEGEDLGGMKQWVEGTLSCSEDWVAQYGYAHEWNHEQRLDRWAPYEAYHKEDTDG